MTKEQLIELWLSKETLEYLIQELISNKHLTPKFLTLEQYSDVIEQLENNRNNLK